MLRLNWLPQPLFLVICAGVLAALLSMAACQPRLTPTQAATMLAQTSGAMLTQASAMETGNPNNPAATLTLAPVPTAASSVPILLPATGLPQLTPTQLIQTLVAVPTATPINAPDCVNDSEFVADITVPDGTKFDRNLRFVKTWRLRNTGTCAWTSEYSFVHINGPTLAAPLRNPINGLVLPDQEFDISLEFTAPEEPGLHVSQWQLADPAGEQFGTRPYVQIEVNP